MTFQCSPELVPSQEMISVCMANGRWTPDPAELVCTGKPGGIQCSPSYSESSDYSIVCICVCVCVCECVCVCVCVSVCVSNLGNVW